MDRQKENWVRKGRKKERKEREMSGLYSGLLTTSSHRWLDEFLDPCGARRGTKRPQTGN